MIQSKYESWVTKRGKSMEKVLIIFWKCKTVSEVKDCLLSLFFFRYLHIKKMILWVIGRVEYLLFKFLGFCTCRKRCTSFWKSMSDSVVKRILLTQLMSSLKKDTFRNCQRRMARHRIDIYSWWVFCCSLIFRVVLWYIQVIHFQSFHQLCYSFLWAAVFIWCSSLEGFLPPSMLVPLPMACQA